MKVNARLTSLISFFLIKTTATFVLSNYKNKIMKNLIITFVLGLFIVTNACSQSTPKPPKTPSTSTSTSYSIEFDYDDEKGSNSSVSIKKNENVYKLSARFGKHMTDDIKKTLMKELGKKELKVKGKTSTWTKYNQGEEVFECKLSQGRLRLYVDKEYASEKLIEEMGVLGTLLKDQISGTDSKKQAKEDVKTAQEDIRRAQQDLERAKKQLERLKKQTKDN